MRVLRTNLRTTKEENVRKGMVPRLFMSGNPGGIGHNWVKKLFIKKNFDEDETPEEFGFVQAFAKDNFRLMDVDPAYIRRLEQLPKKKRMAWLKGDWDSFEGQFFEQWDDKVHVLGPNFKLPTSKEYKNTFYYMGYDRVGGYDYASGEVHYACYLQAFVDNLKNIYFWNEFYEKGMGARTQAQYIYPLYRGGPNDFEPITKYAIADASIFSRTQEIRGEMKSNAAIFADCGIVFKRATRDRRNRAGVFGDGLTRAVDGEQSGAIYFRYTCKNAIRTIPELCYARNDPEDVDTDQEDHAYDAASYLTHAVFSAEHPSEPELIETRRERNMRLKREKSETYLKEEVELAYETD